MNFNDLFHADEFVGRHIGLNADTAKEMLETVGPASI